MGMPTTEKPRPRLTLPRPAAGNEPAPPPAPVTERTPPPGSAMEQVFRVRPGAFAKMLNSLGEDELFALGVERIPLAIATGASDDGPDFPNGHLPPGDATPGDPSALPPTRIRVTAEKPFVNTLWQRFVPIPRFDTLFCIWPVRVLDYFCFCRETDIATPDQVNPTGPSHPVVNVSWNDAIAFCQWLTAREAKIGQLPPGHFYRLATDLEWSAAIGLPFEDEVDPAARSKKTGHYPWGREYPPKKRWGNYHQSLTDEFPFTSPVDAYPANEFGIFDLSGNVWEWVDDLYSGSREYRTLRGGSWDFHGPGLLSSARNANAPTARGPTIGFRIVLEVPPPPKKQKKPAT
jgi:hypothetical protein